MRGISCLARVGRRGGSRSSRLRGLLLIGAGGLGAPVAALPRGGRRDRPTLGIVDDDVVSLLEICSARSSTARKKIGVPEGGEAAKETLLRHQPRM